MLRSAPDRRWVSAACSLGLLALTAAAALPVLRLSDARMARFVAAVPEAVVATSPAPVAWPVLTKALLGALAFVLALVLLYTARHYAFALNRLFGRQRHPFLTLDTMGWPAVTVLVAAHNEEDVVDGILDALLVADYPAGRLTIMPVNDRSTDGTRAIIDRYAARYPERIVPFHRDGGIPGKAAALADAARRVTTPLTLVFDADYLPGRDLVKQLVAPFADPQVGAVMGRVVPQNTGRNLLTRLLDLERTGGYQADQQARMNLRLVPQYGGTVGGIRTAALEAVGGWDVGTLAEDTDLTCRLVTNGWKVAYSNRFECYEEVPETWAVRRRQIDRWARGHTRAALQYAGRMLTSRRTPLRERLDGLLLLGVYGMSPVLLLGWALTVVLFYAGAHPLHGVLAALAVAAFNTAGNFAVFFEIATAARLDGARRRIRLLPLNLLGFLVSLTTITGAVTRQVVAGDRGPLVWNKTQRFRRT